MARANGSGQMLLPENPTEITEWLAWAERKVEEHDRLTRDPRSVLESIAEVTRWTYRNG